MVVGGIVFTNYSKLLIKIFSSHILLISFNNLIGLDIHIILDKIFFAYKLILDMELNYFKFSLIAREDHRPVLLSKCKEVTAPLFHICYFVRRG